MKIRLLAVFLLALGSGASAWAGDYADGEILVKYRDTGTTDTADPPMKARVLDTSRRHRWQRLGLPAGVTVEKALAHYRALPEVEYAEPNYIARKAETAPDDFDPQAQWNLQSLNAPLAWDHTQGSEEVIVAVVDTGIFYPHPDLADNLWVNRAEADGLPGADDDGNGIVDDLHGVNFNGNLISGNPLDNDTADWHGTHVAGIAGATGNNGLGVTGVNWRVKLMAAKVLHGPDGEGTTADIVKGIDYAIAHGARVINLSLTIPSYSETLAGALGRADAAGVLTVSAAGNAASNNDFSPYSPAAIRTPNNIAVAAITRNGTLASYSNYGRATVDLAAPGGHCTQYAYVDGYRKCVDNINPVYSTVGTLGSDYNQYYHIAGTSMAAPHVSGLAALVLAHNPDLTHYQVKARLLNGTDSLAALADRTITGGKANAARAVDRDNFPDRPAVFRVSPYQAYAGDTVAITGANFGLASGTVTVGETALPVLSWSDTEVQAEIPLALGEGTLQVNGEGSGFFVRRLNRLPSVTLTVTPDAGPTPLDATLTATAADADGSVVRYEWDLGDGAFSRDTGSTPTLSHRFVTSGLHTVRVRVTDSEGGVATASTTLNVTAGSEGGGDSRCFIATAAFGSPMEKEVMLLRRFRDRYLLTNAPGRAFVDLYYAISPPVADAIRDSSLWRQITRTLLKPVVAAVRWVIEDAEAGSSKPISVEQPEPAPAVAGEYVVGFIPGTTEERARTVVEAEGGTLREYHPAAAYGLTRFATHLPRTEIEARLEAHAEVRYVEPNFIGGKPERP